MMEGSGSLEQQLEATKVSSFKKLHNQNIISFKKNNNYLLFIFSEKLKKFEHVDKT